MCTETKPLLAPPQPTAHPLAPLLSNLTNPIRLLYTIHHFSRSHSLVFDLGLGWPIAMSLMKRVMKTKKERMKYKAKRAGTKVVNLLATVFANVVFVTVFVVELVVALFVQLHRLWVASQGTGDRNMANGKAGTNATRASGNTSESAAEMESTSRSGSVTLGTREAAREISKRLSMNGGGGSGLATSASAEDLLALRNTINNIDETLATLQSLTSGAASSKNSSASGSRDLSGSSTGSRFRHRLANAASAASAAAAQTFPSRIFTRRLPLFKSQSVTSAHPSDMSPFSKWDESASPFVAKPLVPRGQHLNGNGAGTTGMRSSFSGDIGYESGTGNSNGGVGNESGGASSRASKVHDADLMVVTKNYCKYLCIYCLDTERWKADHVYYLV
jgi:hypothetical protein